MINLQKFDIVEQKQFFKRGEFEYNYINYYAKCKECGECHYINMNNKMQVNKKIVHECINCTYINKNIKLW